jgi:hypothetical protein
MFSTKMQLGSIALIAVILLILDRYARIQPLLDFRGAQVTGAIEGFQMPVIFGKKARACGQQFESCPEGTKCGNGLCINTDPKPLEEKMPIPVLPARI